jgi:hypothetical protein
MRKFLAGGELDFLVSFLDDACRFNGSNEHIQSVCSSLTKLFQEVTGLRLAFVAYLTNQMQQAGKFDLVDNEQSIFSQKEVLNHRKEANKIKSAYKVDATTGAVTGAGGAAMGGSSTAKTASSTGASSAAAPATSAATSAAATGSVLSSSSVGSASSVGSSGDRKKSAIAGRWEAIAAKSSSDSVGDRKSSAPGVTGGVTAGDRKSSAPGSALKRQGSELNKPSILRHKFKY